MYLFLNKAVHHIKSSTIHLSPCECNWSCSLKQLTRSVVSVDPWGDRYRQSQQEDRGSSPRRGPRPSPCLAPARQESVRWGQRTDGETLRQPGATLPVDALLRGKYQAVINFMYLTFFLLCSWLFPVTRVRWCSFLNPFIIPNLEPKCAPGDPILYQYFSLARKR